MKVGRNTLSKVSTAGNACTFSTEVLKVEDRVAREIVNRGLQEAGCELRNHVDTWAEANKDIAAKIKKEFQKRASAIKKTPGTVDVNFVNYLQDVRTEVFFFFFDQKEFSEDPDIALKTQNKKNKEAFQRIFDSTKSFFSNTVLSGFQLFRSVLRKLTPAHKHLRTHKLTQPRKNAHWHTPSHTFTHTRRQALTHSCTCDHKHTCTHTHTQKHRHKGTHAHTHTHIHAHAHTRTHVHSHTRTRVYANVLYIIYEYKYITHTHINTYTYIHTHNVT